MTMAHIQITGQFDVKEVANNMSDYRFYSPITLQEFISLFENMNPKDYRNLAWNDVIEVVQETIPDSVVEVLVSNGLSYNDFIYQSTLTPTMVKKLVNSADADYDVTGLISKQVLTIAQFKTLVTSTEKELDAEELADAISDNGNIEFAKFIVKSWDSLPSLENEELKQFTYHLFIGLGSTILTDNDSRKLFGKVRPTMSSEELRSYDPCRGGWKRCMKWAGRNETSYTWNEFIARHILSSATDVESAKGDLTWLGEVVIDSLGWFDEE